MSYSVIVFQVRNGCESIKISESQYIRHLMTFSKLANYHNNEFNYIATTIHNTLIISPQSYEEKVKHPNIYVNL